MYDFLNFTNFIHGKRYVQNKSFLPVFPALRLPISMSPHSLNQPVGTYRDLRGKSIIAQHLTPSAAVCCVRGIPFAEISNRPAPYSGQRSRRAGDRRPLDSSAC
jgi:hypothetical protein